MFLKQKILSSIFIVLLLSQFSAFGEVPFEERIKSKYFKIQTSTQNLKNMHSASTLLISCVDFRLRDETEKLMNHELGLLDDYDEIAIPGGSLALVSANHPHWKATIEDIIAMLEKLHNIKRVILLDHRDCGAYKLVKGHEHTKSQKLETEAHYQTLSEAKKNLTLKFPNLKVYTLLLDLDGTVEQFD